MGIGPVVAGKVVASPFVKKTAKKSEGNSYYDGTWEELERLVADNFDDNEPGTGSQDGDVLLVRVPVDGFHTSIVKVTEENAHLVQTEAHIRQEGEAPYTRRVMTVEKSILGDEMPAASVVKIVVYRADVLAQDNNRSSDAEWEIVAILAQDEENVPMHPETMKRNASHATGGTLRKYTKEQWDESYAYWSDHVYIVIR